jgi:Tfx family DNA-binding protein
MSTSVYMKNTLLTDRQKEVLRFRKQGLTQQQIADRIRTSKANVCTVEKAALDKIRRAKETIMFLYSLDASSLCVIKAGTDLLEVPPLIYREAEKRGIKVKYDTISLLNHVRNAAAERCRGRNILDEITVYINDEGELYYE